MSAQTKAASRPRCRSEPTGLQCWPGDAADEVLKPIGEAPPQITIKFFREQSDAMTAAVMSVKGGTEF
jgi:hypothetical protein